MRAGAERAADENRGRGEAGFLALTGEPDGPPQRMGLSMVDYVSGITAAFALTAALLGARDSGKGQDVDVSLFDVAIHQLTYPATWYLNARDAVARKPRSGHPSVVPCELLPTQDGHIFVMCVLPKFWEALCVAFGQRELLADPRFASAADRRENRDALIALLDAVSVTRTSAEWITDLSGNVPAAPVLDLADALDNPYLEEVEAIGTVAHPDQPELRLLRSPIRLNGDRPALACAPGLGEDTDRILNELGYDANRRAALRANGTI